MLQGGVDNAHPLIHLLPIRDLNKTLHLNKVSESDRSILISAVLIALERESFKRGYQAEEAPAELARMVVKSSLAQLDEEASLDEPRRKVLEQKFGFLNTSPVLTSKPGELRKIIQEVDQEISSFAKTHQYRDVLGALYIEFLRYANSDKGLGIVLTPPHITELFAEIAEVNTKSIVYDNCAGTGGFLISAMKLMLDKARGDLALERDIKRNRLFGVELQPSIYPLAVSNMYIHQDGKSNIVHGNCFDQSTINCIRSKLPTVGLLNPPYKADKKGDTEELRFVLNNLECLQQGGVCVAIVPMQCALAKGGRIGDLKKRLFEAHTLEAVLSMPNELFFNSNVGVVSCIMVFTAHRPHPNNKRVFLGYYKDDGFVKDKIEGRHDAFIRWQAIKENWLELYRNRRTVRGLSVNVELGYKDEWAAEAYMDTDYSSMTPAMFETTLLNYSTYLFGSQLIPTATTASSSKRRERPTIDFASWDDFELTSLFDVKGSKTTPIRELQLSGEGPCPYVTTQATNNGVSGSYGISTEKGNVLTVDSAVLGYCAYQEQDFSASDHVEVLKPKFKLDAYVAMFLVTVINMDQYRYNYGRKCSQTRLRQMRLRLPAKDGMPDFAYMRDFIQKLDYSDNL